MKFLPNHKNLTQAGLGRQQRHPCKDLSPCSLIASVTISVQVARETLRRPPKCQLCHRISHLCIWAWDFLWLFCFSFFPDFQNFVFYSYGVGHDFHDNLQDTFRRKMTSGGAVAHGNSPSWKHPFGFCSWSLLSQSQFVQIETRRCCPSVPNTLEDEDSSKNWSHFFRKKSQENDECRQASCMTCGLVLKGSTWTQTAGIFNLTLET